MDLGNGRLFKEAWYGGYNTCFIAVHVQLIKVHHQTNMYSHILTLTLKIFCFILRKEKKKYIYIYIYLWQIKKKSSLFFFVRLEKGKYYSRCLKLSKKKKTVNLNYKCLNHPCHYWCTSANNLSCTKNVHTGISM